MDWNKVYRVAKANKYNGEEDGAAVKAYLDSKNLGVAGEDGKEIDVVKAFEAYKADFPFAWPDEMVRVSYQGHLDEVARSVLRKRLEPSAHSDLGRGKIATEVQLEVGEREVHERRVVLVGDVESVTAE